LELLYKDKSVIVCKKPAGLVSEGGSGMGMPDLLGKELAAAGEPSLLYPVNRLDREAEGLLLLARDEQAAAALSRQAAEHLMEKEYLAIVSGEPEEASGIYRDLLFHDRNKNKTYVTDRMRKGVKEAVLRYRTLGSVNVGDHMNGSAGSGSACGGSKNVGKAADGILANGPTDGALTGGKSPQEKRSGGGSPAQESEKKLSLLQIWLETGRTHQIRVQFASRKMPLFGDGKYGGGPGRLALQSHRITFRHPSSGETITVTAPFPAGVPWDLFPETIIDKSGKNG